MTFAVLIGMPSFGGFNLKTKDKEIPCIYKYHIYIYTYLIYSRTKLWPSTGGNPQKFGPIKRANCRDHFMTPTKRINYSSGKSFKNYHTFA